jgi:hypothetical protein
VTVVLRTRRVALGRFFKGGALAQNDDDDDESRY